MRVVHVFSELRYSGGELMILAATPTWRELGMELHVIEVGSHQGPFGRVLREHGWIVHQVPCESRWRLFSDLSRKTREIGPDVIHAQAEGHVLQSAAAGLATGVPVIRTVLHNFPFRGWLRFQTIMKRAAVRRMGATHVTASLGNQLNEMKAYRNPSVLIDSWLPPGMAVPKPCGGAAIEDECRERLRQFVEAADLVVMTVGGCTEYKNHDLILTAIARLHEDERQARVVYVHVGDASQERAREEERALELGISDRVMFLSGLPDVGVVYEVADVFLQPSREEGFGVAIAEALAAGIDCVLSDRPAHNLAFPWSDGVEWIEPTVDALVLAVRERCSERAVRHRRYQQRGSEVSAAFSPKIGALRYAMLYELARRGALKGRWDLGNLNGLRTTIVGDPEVTAFDVAAGQTLD